MFIVRHKAGYFLGLISLISSLFFMSCDKGISPLAETVSGSTGFQGKVIFSGTWPAGIQQTYLAVFKEPLKAATDFPPPNLSYIIGPIVPGTTTYIYNSIDNKYSPNFKLVPGSYHYIVILQSAKPNLTLNWNDWVIAGIYYADNDTTKPGTLILEDGKITPNINIICNFSKPPPQPQQTNWIKDE